MMSQLNQQRLSALQQERMNPYQAYINSQQAVTGQGCKFSSSLDATRASSMNDVIRDLMITLWTDIRTSSKLSWSKAYK